MVIFSCLTWQYMPLQYTSAMHGLLYALAGAPVIFILATKLRAIHLPFISIPSCVETVVKVPPTLTLPLIKGHKVLE